MGVFPPASKEMAHAKPKRAISGHTSSVSEGRVCCQPERELIRIFRFPQFALKIYSASVVFCINYLKS